uniref:Uncharacterized protein n=1 Tax=Candidatus Nitrotoga fabula TaxID=2182327 RepID=A0A2X0QXE6_9PROT|nr:protein of unknown function [Candidatus Nitrotoga fabula]
MPGPPPLPPGPPPGLTACAKAVSLIQAPADKIKISIVKHLLILSAFIISLPIGQIRSSSDGNTSLQYNLETIALFKKFKKLISNRYTIPTLHYQ